MFATSILRAALVVALCGMSGAARAVTFNFVNIGGAEVGTQARRGFEVAANYWSSVLTDDVTVKLNIGFQSLGGGIIGSTSSLYKVVSIQSTYAALAADATSALDASAVASLPTLGPSSYGVGAVSPTVNAFATKTVNGAVVEDRSRYSDFATRIDNDGSANNVTLGITTANAKALGLTRDFSNQPINPNGVDGSISFSSDYAFDFNPTDGIESNSYDFIGVAIHEIGHALGFVSGVDTYDLYTTNGPNSAQGNGLEGLAVASPFDLFRYSAPGVMDWSTSDSTKYFSINGGTGQLYANSAFSLGAYNGDGRQASHWQDAAGEAQLGIMDPTTNVGQLMMVTGLDLAAYDAFGWNLAVDVLTNPNYTFSSAQAYSAFSATPEAATWVEMLLGFGALGLVRRRQRVAIAAR